MLPPNAPTVKIPPEDSRICGRFLIAVSDAHTLWQDLAKPYEQKQVGSRQSDAVEIQRAQRLANWALHEALPAVLEDEALAREWSEAPSITTVSRLVENLVCATRAVQQELSPPPVALAAYAAAVRCFSWGYSRAELNAAARLSQQTAQNLLTASSSDAAQAFWPKIAALLDELYAMKAA